MEYCYEEELSPTDTSEDSIEISVKPIHKKFSKNKRKSAEPKRVRLAGKMETIVTDCNKNESPSIKRESIASEFSHLAPKKRFKMDAMLDLEREEEMKEQERNRRLSLQNSNQPFRPWTAAEAFSFESERKMTFPESPVSRLSASPVSSPTPPSPQPSSLPVPSFSFAGLPAALCQQLNLTSPTALLLSYAALRASTASIVEPAQSSFAFSPESIGSPAMSVTSDVSGCEQDEPLSLVVKKSCDKVEKVSKTIVDKKTVAEDKALISPPTTPTKKQTNYKSKTRDRRVEANARERRRVHTITAAFDTLQSAIPTEQENGVKLSKLSVIKIATAYIMALSRMAGHDYTEDQSNPSLEEVLENYRQTVREETKVKTRKS